MHTLIIDDDDIGIFLTQRLLERERFSDDFASFTSAEQALAHLQAAPDAELPRVIFLDLNMPGMDGWGFLDALRLQETRLRDRCRIYILTSSLAHADTSRGQGYALVAGLLHKPIDAEQIQALKAELAAASPD